jgi:hypothetical protein
LSYGYDTITLLFPADNLSFFLPQILASHCVEYCRNRDKFNPISALRKLIAKLWDYGERKKVEGHL